MTNTTTADIFIHLMDFPDNTKETVSPNEDGSFSIFINSRLSYEGQLMAYNHAMKHIENDDFNKTDVQAIEVVAHEIMTSGNLKPIPADDYIEELNRLRRQRRKLKKQIRKDEERIKLLVENCDMFARAETEWLYGNDF